MSTRRENSLRNIQFAIIGQAFGLIISFIARRVFVMTLDSEYLGLNGLFTNILSILSLAELGVGTSIIFSMYKPLADNNIEKIKQLMNLYKTAYTIIGCMVFIIGISLTPFLNIFVTNMPEIPNIEIIYVLYVVNSSVSYFFIYKRSLIIADQKRYIATLYRYGIYALYNLIQIIVLIISKNYILFMMVLITATIAENILISRKANQLYPYLKEKTLSSLPKEDKEKIKKNVFAMLCHKIGGVVVSGTDNLLIAKFAGIIIVGIYSNYLMVIAAINSLYSLLFQSITASIGNLNIHAKQHEKLVFFENFMFIGAWMYGLASIMLYCLLNPLIVLWLSKDYLFSMDIVSLIVFNFYLSGMRQPVLTTRDAMGLFWKDRYKPLAESIVNIMASVLLGKHYGIAGVLIGTIISTLSICFWVEPLILYKYAFQDKLRKYFMKYFLYTFVNILALVVTYSVCGVISDDGLVNFGIKILVCLLIPNLLYLIFYYNTKEFRYVQALIDQVFGKILAKICK